MVIETPKALAISAVLYPDAFIDEILLILAALKEVVVLGVAR